MLLIGMLFFFLASMRITTISAESDLMDCSLQGSSVCGILQARSTGVGSHSLLQGIFLTQGSNLDLLHCRQVLYHLNYQESPILAII